MTGNRFYLNKQEGKILGVCAGFAEYLGVDTLWVRVAAVALTILGSFVTVPVYLIIAMLASRRPQDMAGYDWLDEEERRVRRTASSRRVRSDIGDIDRRLAKVESYYGTNSRLSNDIDGLR